MANSLMHECECPELHCGESFLTSTEFPSFSGIPRIDLTSFETAPFSESFSELINLEDMNKCCNNINGCMSAFMGSMAGPDSDNFPRDADMTFEIENFTNMKDLMPEWDDDEIDEVIVISPKTRLPTIQEERESQYERDNVDLSYFDFLHVLSNTDSATVTLDRKRDTGKLFALKSIRGGPSSGANHKFLSSPAFKLANDLDSAYIAKVHWSFFDEECLFLVMDFYPGGTLYSHIERFGFLSPDVAQFYASEIAAGIADLHAAGIVHRNISTKNILVQSDGHVVLTGFQHAQFLGPSASHLYRSSPNYDPGQFQAPEMLLGWAHGFAVDCWSFGALLYEVLFGKRSFASAFSLGDSSLRSCIVRRPVSFPFALDLITEDFLLKCLERNSALRANIQEIQAHEYFSGLDWTQLAAKNVKVPYRPVLDEGRIDLRYFSEDSTVGDTNFHRTKMDSMLQGNQKSTKINQDASRNQYCPLFNTPLDEATSLNSSTKVLPNPVSGRADFDTFCTQLECRSPTSRSNLNGSSQELGAQQIDDLFWHALSRNQSAFSSGPTLDSNALSIPPPCPTKLHKKLSFMSLKRLLTATAVAPVARNKLKKRRRLLSTVTLRQSEELDLPKGIKQIGHGIGYTYDAPRPQLSICTTTPQTCHGLFYGKLQDVGGTYHGRKSMSQLNQCLDSHVLPAQPHIMHDVYDSTWSIRTAPMALVSPSTHDPVNSPLSDDELSTPTFIDFQEMRETKSGDTPMTLRLVSPSERQVTFFGSFSDLPLEPSYIYPPSL